MTLYKPFTVSWLMAPHRLLVNGTYNGVHFLRIEGLLYRIEIGTGDLYREIPITVAFVTHFRDGKPLAWSVISDSDLRKKAILALISNFY